MISSPALLSAESRLRDAGLLGDFVSVSLVADGSVVVWVTSPGDRVLTDSGEVLDGLPVLLTSAAPASAPSFAAVSALFPEGDVNEALGVIAL